MRSINYLALRIDQESSAASKIAARIFIVDDLADNREVLTRRLSRRGYEIVEAGGGAEALCAIEMDG